MLLEFAESGCPIFRVTIPLSRCKLKSKGHGKLSIHYCADSASIETIFQYNCLCQSAQSNMCEEYESLHDRSGQLDEVMGQSIVLSVKSRQKSWLRNDDPAYQNFLLQQCEEQIERFSQQDKVTKFVWMQDFWVLLKFDSFLKLQTLEKQPRGWIQGNIKIGPVLEITTRYLYGKHGIEIRIWSWRR